MTRANPGMLAGDPFKAIRLSPFLSNLKKFSNFVGIKTRYQQSSLNLSSAEQIKFALKLKLTNIHCRFISVEQMQGSQIELGPVSIKHQQEAKS